MSQFSVLPLFLLLSWTATALLAVPIWLLWTICGLGSRYFAFLPAAWQSISLLNMVGLLLLFAIGRSAARKAEISVKADM